MHLFLSSSHLYKKFAFRGVSNFSSSLCQRVGPDSVVGIVTCHGLDGQGIEFWWGRGFSCPSSLALESIQPPVQCVLAVFLWGKMAWDWY